MRVRALAVVSAIAIAACGGPTAPVHAVEISITDSVEARRSPNEVNVVIPVKVKNLDQRILYYEQCGHVLLRRDGTDWRSVPLPPCRPSGYSFALSEGESYQFTFRIRATMPSEEWPAIGASGEYRVVLWLTSVPRNVGGIPLQPLAVESRTSPTFSITEVVIVIQGGYKRRTPAEDGLASSAGAFPLAVIDDSVRCAETEVSVTSTILPLSNGFDSGVPLPARLQLCPATSQPVLRFELSKYHVTMTSHRNAFRFGKPVTEAECEYKSTDQLVKRNFSTTFSQTFPRILVEKNVES